MAVNRLFSVEFAKQGSSGENTFNFNHGITGSGYSFTPGIDNDVTRQRAYINYSAPILRRLASKSDVAVDERDLFRAVAHDVPEPDFQDFRLALLDLAEQRFITAADRNEFGDPRYKITDYGMAVAPATA